MISDTEIKKSHRNIILCQCTGLLAMQFMGNGIILNYLMKFGVKEDTTFLLLTFIPNIIGLLLTLPLAHLSDKVGLKKIGNRGNCLQVLGFVLLALAYFLPAYAVVIFSLAMVLYSLGGVLFASNWFALLDPLIEAETRGRFFARLRITWQCVGITATFIVSNLILFSDSKKMYLGILVFGSLMLLVRIIFYQRIPELTKPNRSLGNIKESWHKLRQNRAYMKFSMYCFVMTFLVSGLASFLFLFEKGSLAFSEGQIVLMGFCAQAGSLLGYWVGAMVVDKRGTALLFNLVNFSYLVLVSLFIFIKFLPLPVELCAALFTFVLGVVFCAKGIGSTSEALRLVDKGAKSFGIGFSATTAACGGTFGSLLTVQYLKFGGEWNWSVSSYAFGHYEIYLGFVFFGLIMVNIFFRFKEEQA